MILIVYKYFAKWLLQYILCSAKAKKIYVIKCKLGNPIGVGTKKSASHWHWKMFVASRESVNYL